MSTIKELQAELAVKDAAEDLDGLRDLRQRLVQLFPHSDEAAEAHYKLGLDLLFRARNIDAAMVAFDAAASLKHPWWSQAARTSMGLCYVHQRRVQKALFELRKVAYAKQLSVHSVTALTFIETLLIAEKLPEEALRARKDRIGQLEHLVSPAYKDTLGAGRPHLLAQLGLALADSKHEARAKHTLQQALDAGQQALGPDLYRQVKEALEAP